MPVESESPLTSGNAPGTRSGSSLTEPPGGFLIWLIVLVELVTFGIGMGVFLVQKHHDPEVFKNGQIELGRAYAFFNTVVLLTGSWWMANAMATLKSGDLARSMRWLAGSTLAGVVFLGLKGMEYAIKLGRGFDLHHNAFFSLYWLLTGFHYLHVMVAVILLTVMWRGVLTGKYTPASHEDVESTGIFWHMCDLIWLLLMPIIYLFP
jgi:nitric oxide reductase NorE protein